ncbi:MAG: hypothetical protein PHH47_01355 [Gallionella sp.]|nr:hypothetical protein [Gallionella sp.]MDD4946116.1 hypothetical protein [Gallionella sp.]
MIWIVGLLLAFVFVKLGMLIIMVKLLAVALKLALLVIAGFAIAFMWRKLFGLKLNTCKVFQPKQIISRGK